MGIATGGESEWPLIAGREAAREYAEECGLATMPDQCLLMLLTSKSRLLSTKLLPVAALDTIDADAILQAALEVGASAFALVTCAQVGLPPEVRCRLSKAASICSELGVDFVDYVQITGSADRSLVWDPDAGRSLPPNPWSNG